MAFLDVDLAGQESWQVVRDLKDKAPATKLVLLTPRLDNDALLEAVRLGVRGVLPRSADSSLIIKCLCRVRDGGHWLDKHMTATALRAKVRGEATRRQLAQVGLTPRELEIAALAGEGKAVVAIAATLKISPATVNVHLQRVYRKLGVSDRLELIVYTRRRAVAVA